MVYSLFFWAKFNNISFVNLRCFLCICYFIRVSCYVNYIAIDNIMTNVSVVRGTYVYIMRNVSGLAVMVIVVLC